jgi:hypothetical protein
MARRTKKKLSPLKIGAIILVGGGVGYLLYSQVIKKYFFKSDESSDGGGEVETTPEIETDGGGGGGGSTSGGGGGGGGGTNSQKPQPQKTDIDKKIKKGDKGDGVYRVQLAINAIARLRGKNYWWDNDKKKNVQFPLPTDPVRSEFADRTDSGAKFAFPSYRGSGYITVRKAREQWVRSAGHFKKPFPTELVNVSNYADLKKIYDINRAKKQANDESDFYLNPAAAAGAAFSNFF